MVSLKWCLSKEKGIELIESNENMSRSYIGMAGESVKIIENVNESNIWTAATTYYIFYYSLYALMMRIGVKCEIHTCSLEFMKQMLTEFYSVEDVEAINSAFSARTDLQYYANRPVEPVIIQRNKKYSKDFYIKSKDVLSRITERQIDAIRQRLAKERSSTR